MMLRGDDDNAYGVLWKGLRRKRDKSSRQTSTYRTC